MTRVPLPPCVSGHQISPPNKLGLSFRVLSGTLTRVPDFAMFIS